jgi:hypothetical protein
VNHVLYLNLDNVIIKYFAVCKIFYSHDLSKNIINRYFTKIFIIIIFRVSYISRQLKHKKNKPLKRMISHDI